MFVFKSNGGLIVTCSCAGTFGSPASKSDDAIFHLEKLGTLKHHGYIHCVECVHSSPEQWVEYFRLVYGWNVYPVKLIEIEWE